MFAPVIERVDRGALAIEANTNLRIEHGTTGIELDGQRDEEKYRQEHGECDNRQQNVHYSIHGIRACPGLEPRRGTRVRVEHALALTARLARDGYVQCPLHGRSTRRGQAGQRMANPSGPWSVGAADACTHGTL
jgi:hypothetical protein